MGWEEVIGRDSKELHRRGEGMKLLINWG